MHGPVATQIDSGALAGEIEAYLSRAEIALRDRDLGPTLEIAGHRPLISYDHAKRRSLLPKPIELYEVAATLLVSFLIGRLRPRVFFDVGAATGHFSRVAASHLISPAVHAFEMQPHHIACLRDRVTSDGLDHRVTAHLAALSDRHEGNKDIWFAHNKLFEYEPRKHEYQRPWWQRVRLAPQGKHRRLIKASVLLTSIDQFVAEHGVVPDLLKIDVDGYEGKVLRGGLKTFASYKPLIALELHKDKHLRYGDTRRELVALLSKIGYEALFLTDHHDPRACRVIRVNQDHPLIWRGETDFILFC